MGVLAVNIRFQGVTAAQLQDFRRSLPADARFTIAKNSLIRIASEEVDGWSDFGKLANFESGVLVVEERIGDAIKAYENFTTKLDKSGKKDIFPVQGGVLNGKLLTSSDVLKLKTLPTKEEAMTQIATVLKKPPIMFALALKGVPSKLGRVINGMSKTDKYQNKI